MNKNLYIILLSVVFSIILWVSISLSNDYGTSMQLPIRIINVPEGYVPTSPSSDLITVKVKGKGWNLLNSMITAQHDYYVDAGNDLQKKKVLNLKSFASENSWLTSKVEIIEVIPDTISFKFEKIDFAKLKIVPHLQLDFKTGYGIARDFIVIPESTIASGAAQKINSMVEVPTELLKISDLSEKMERVIELKSTDGITYDVESVKIILDVQRIVEQSYDEIEVSVSDIPKDRQVVLLPNKINVQLRGGIDVLGKLDKSEIIASVYYRDVVLDTIGSIIPHLKIPNHTQLINIRPPQVKYIIKKFNK